ASRLSDEVVDGPAIQSLHVYGAARFRPGAGATLRPGSLRDELRQSEPPRRARGRGAAALAAAATRRLRFVARGVGPPGISQAPGRGGGGRSMTWVRATPRFSAGARKARTAPRRVFRLSLDIS